MAVAASHDAPLEIHRDGARRHDTHQPAGHGPGAPAAHRREELGRHAGRAGARHPCDEQQRQQPGGPLHAPLHRQVQRVAQGPHPGRPAGLDDAALADLMLLAAACLPGAVDGLGPLDVVLRRRQLDGGVADGLVAPLRRDDVGLHPVVAAVLVAVADQARPRLAAAQGSPEVGEHAGGHLRVPHDVVRHADGLLRRQPRGPLEGRVGVGDAALRIGDGDDGRVAGAGGCGVQGSRQEGLQSRCCGRRHASSAPASGL